MIGGRKIKSVGKSIEDILSLSNAYFAFTPVCQASTSEKNENDFFVPGFKFPNRP
jgi:hypothetical protein